MTKYSEIAALAVKHAERFYAQKEECRQLARLIAKNVKAHLEAPDEAITYVELDEDLKSKWEPVNAPELVQGDDGLWYFGLRVHFSVPSHAAFARLVLKFGMKGDGQRCTVKLEVPYSLVVSDLTTWQPMLNDIVKGLELAYAAEQGSPAAKPIGFIQTYPSAA